MPLRRLRGLSTFRRGFASTFVLDVAARAISAITLVLLLRALTVESFAFVILLLNVGQFLGGAATGGLRLRYVRTQAERVSRQLTEPSSFYVTFRTGTLLILAVSALGLLGATALGVGSAGERTTFAAIATAYTLGHATIELSIYHYQAQVAFSRAGLLSVLRSSIGLLVALGASVGLLSSGAAVGAAFAVGLGGIATVVAGPLAWSTRKSHVDREGRFGFGRESASLTIDSVASAGRYYSGFFLVALLLDNAAVAAYGAAVRYTSIVTGPVPALLSVLRVRTAQKDMVASEEAQVGFMARWAKRTGPPMVVLFGAAAIAAPVGIPLLDGGKYPLSVPVFQVMLVASFTHLITLPSTSVLMAQKRYQVLAWVNTIAVALNVATVTVVASPLGVVGVAAVATLVNTGQNLAVTYMAAHPPEIESDHRAGVVR